MKTRSWALVLMLMVSMGACSTKPTGPKAHVHIDFTGPAGRKSIGSIASVANGQAVGAFTPKELSFEGTSSADFSVYAAMQYEIRLQGFNQKTMELSVSLNDQKLERGNTLFVSISDVGILSAYFEVKPDMLK